MALLLFVYPGLEVGAGRDDICAVQDIRLTIICRLGCSWEWWDSIERGPKQMAFI